MEDQDRNMDWEEENEDMDDELNEASYTSDCEDDNPCGAFCDMPDPSQPTHGSISQVDD